MEILLTVYDEAAPSVTEGGSAKRALAPARCLILPLSLLIFSILFQNYIATEQLVAFSNHLRK